MIIRSIYLFAILVVPFSISAQTSNENIFSSTYVGIEKDNYTSSDYAVFNLSNIGGKDIDDIGLFLSLMHKKTGLVSSTFLTDQTKGLIWMQSGSKIKVGVPISSAEDLKMVKSESGELYLKFEIKNISFMGE